MPPKPGSKSRIKTVSAAEAVQGIRSHERVFIGSGAAEPVTLVEAMCITSSPSTVLPIFSPKGSTNGPRH